MGKFGTFLCLGVIFCGGLSFSNNGLCTVVAGEEHLSSGAAAFPDVRPQSSTPDGRRGGHDAGRDRLSASHQEEYLGALKNVNKDLRNEYRNLIKNFVDSKIAYTASKPYIEGGGERSNNLLKNLQDLEVEKEKIEARIKNLEVKKSGLREEALSFYRGRLPGELSQEWDKEEGEYSNYVNAIYRQLGWWLQLGYSSQSSEDQRRFWNNIREYYRQHENPLDELSQP